MNKNTAELWVKIIAILGIIWAILAIIGGIFMLVGGGFLGTMLPFLGTGILGGAVVGALLVVTGVVVIVIGLLELFVAIGLWKHKNWARIVAVVLAMLGILGGIGSLIASPGMGIVNIVLNGAIFYLLALNKDIRKLFK